MLGLFALVIIFLLAGMVTLQARSLLKPPTYGTPEYEAFQDRMRLISFVGVVLLDAGVGVLVMTALVALVQRHDLPDAVRRGLMIFATVVAALWLVGALLFGGFGFP